MQTAVSFDTFLPLLPVIIVALTAVAAMLAIAVKRHHFTVGTLTVIGLNSALALLVYNMYQDYSTLGYFSVQAVTSQFLLDGFAKVFMVLILIAGLACTTLAHAYIDGFKANREELYVLLACGVAGAMLLTAAQHFAAFFVSLELMSISVIAMVAYTFERQHSLEAGVKYLISSAAASAAMLMGMALIYGYTGTLSYAAAGVQLLQAMHQPLLVIGVVLFLAGVGFKLSMVPFHLWTADVYQGSPSPITTFLATVSKAAVMAAFLRFLLVAAPLAMEGLRSALVFIIVMCIVLGNLLALRQVNLKRLLAFSSIAHIGYVLIAIVSIGKMSVPTITLYMVVYVLMSIGTFGVIALMSSSYDGDEADSMASYRGLFWRHPVLTAVLTVMMLALAGVPTTTGLIAKMYIFISTVSTAQWFLAAMLILGSVIGLYYYLRVIVVMYMTPADNYKIDLRPHWGVHAGGVVVLLTVVATIGLGLYPEPLLFIAKLAQMSAQ